MGKGEIACYEQFLLFSSVFKRHVLQLRKNQGLFGKGLTRLALHCMYRAEFMCHARIRLELFFQIIGFLILVIGMALYNDILIMPYVRKWRERKNVNLERRANENGEHGERTRLLQNGMHTETSD